MKTILLLEDDKNLNMGIALKLQKEGYEVLSAYGVTEAERLFAAKHVDLIISDITLEDGNGLKFCRRIRQQSDVYIIFLTALNGELDIVHAYDIGGDDYITKPFSLSVLMSKVQACMRRVAGIAQSRIVSGEIEVVYEEMNAYRRENEVGERERLSLSKKELQLLLFLMENAKQIVSKEQILEHVWGIDGQFVDENTVPVNISRLKGKLKNEYIHNVRGLGYIWTEESIKE